MKELSIFIDESGDFGRFSHHSPYYIISLVFHEQNHDISSQLKDFENKLMQLGFANHSIHTAPIIRKELSYIDIDLILRRKLLSLTMAFIRKIDVKWSTISITKKQFDNFDEEISKLAKELSNFIKNNINYMLSFDNIKIYYDNGQTEIKTLINSVFSSNLPNVIMKNIQSTDYRLFQVADLICTFDLLYKKYITKQLSKSEIIFFGNERNLYRNYIKPLAKLKFKNYQNQ